MYSNYAKNYSAKSYVINLSLLIRMKMVAGDYT